MTAYYPRRVGTFKDLEQAFPNDEFEDPKEEYRLESIRMYDIVLVWLEMC